MQCLSERRAQLNGQSLQIGAARRGFQAHRGVARRLNICAAVKKQREKQVVCSKTLVAKAGKEAALERKCRDILDFSLGKASNKDNGIVEFVCSRDLYESNVFHFWERYDGNVSLGRHNTSPEFMSFMEGVQDLLEEPIGLALYAFQDGQLSNVCVQGGPKGEGGLDDATGASKSAGAAGMKQTSSALNLGKVKRGDEGDSWGMGFKFPWQKKKDDKK